MATDTITVHLGLAISGAVRGELKYNAFMSGVSYSEQKSSGWLSADWAIRFEHANKDHLKAFMKGVRTYLERCAALD